MPSLYVDSLAMKHSVSQLHPDPFIRARTHLLLGTGAKYSFNVPITPEVTSALHRGANILRPMDLSKGSQISVFLTNVQYTLLKKKATPITMIEPLTETVQALLQLEQQST